MKLFSFQNMSELAKKQTRQSALGLQRKRDLRMSIRRETEPTKIKNDEKGGRA